MRSTNGYGSHRRTHAATFRAIQRRRIAVWAMMKVQLPTHAAIRSATRSPRVRSWAAAFSISAMIATLRRVSSSIERIGSIRRASAPGLRVPGNAAYPISANGTPS